MLLVLLQLQQASSVAQHMLVPGIRLIERPGALHLFDGRRVVSITGDGEGRAAILAAVRRSGTHGDDAMSDSAVSDSAVSDSAMSDARRLLGELRLIVADPDARSVPAPNGLRAADDVAAAYVSAATAGWVAAGRAARRLRQVTVHVLGPAGPASGGMAAAVPDPAASGSSEAVLTAALAASGIRTQPLAGPDDITRLHADRDIVAVVGGDDDPAELLVAANTVCVRAGVPLFPVGGYDGARMHIGPLVIPHQSACVDCMLRRAAANVTYSDLFDIVLSAPVAPTPPALRQWAASVASLALLRWIGDGDVRMPGRLFTLVPDELRIRQSVVYRVPRCRICAAPDFEPRAAPWEPARDH